MKKLLLYDKIHLKKKNFLLEVIELKKIFATIICCLMMTGTANAEVRTYEGTGQYIMSDFETPELAKQRAKQRAEIDAQEKAGVWISSNVRVVNMQLQAEEIETMTAGIMCVQSVTYDAPITDSSGFIFTAHVVVDIDTAEIERWLEQNNSTRAELTEQNRALQETLAQQEQQLAELREKLANYEQNQNQIQNYRLQIQREFSATENAFLSGQKLKEGVLAHNRGDYLNAIAAYTDAIELNQNNVAAYTWRGNAYGAIQDYRNAERDLTKAVQMDEKNVNALVGLGIALFATHSYNNAIVALDRAIQIDNQNAKAYYTRSRCLEAIGRYREAREDYNYAMRLGYNN